jgi:hypothetical protein
MDHESHDESWGKIHTCLTAVSRANMQAGGGADDRRVIEVGGLQVIVWAGTPGNPIIFVR